MELLAAFLVGFPFVSAILLAVIKNNNARKIITYISSGLLITAAISVALCASFGENTALQVEESGLLCGIAITELTDKAMLIGECALALFVAVMGIKYKKYIVVVFAAFQTAVELWYELSGKMPEYTADYMHIDNLTVIMILIIAVVGTLITVYACGYMQDYHKHHTDVKDRRSYFFSVMYIFLGAMFGLVLSNNLMWIYFFWEVTSVCSFLLIGYTKTPEAINNCFRALWMNLLGGCAMICGIVILGTKYSICDIQALLNGNISHEALNIPIMLLAFGALTKSAQLPFSRWLLGAMVAPTPSSALLHSATMVKAGVYLLIRLSPVMADQLSGYMVGLVGGLTFLAASMLAITVSDGKEVLAYSTISNLGLITACAGIGDPETVWAAMFLVIFHAVSKALLFQTVGAIEHQTGSRNIETMHGLVRRYPALTWTLVVGIAGMFLAPFGMLVSKWAALKAFVDTGLHGHSALLAIVSTLLVLCICFGSSTTLLYWAKWLTTILSSNPETVRHKNTITVNQWVSLFLHAAMMIAICLSFSKISDIAVLPYIKSTFGTVSEILSSENFVITIMMIVFVFFVPMATYFLIARKRPFKKADRYFNGAGTKDQVGFIDSMGSEKKEFLTNWYMTEIFSAERMYKPSVIVAILLIVGFAAAGLIIGGGF